MKKITIVDTDRPGLLADITKILAEQNININYIEADAHKDIGIVILSVDKYDEALNSLKNANFYAFTENVIILKLKDQPGALAKIAMRFKEADINMRSIRIVKRENDFAIVAVCAEKTKHAIKLVEDVLVS
jgi:hypothetical protein